MITHLNDFRMPDMGDVHYDYLLLRDLYRHYNTELYDKFNIIIQDNAEDFINMHLRSRNEQEQLGKLQISFKQQHKLINIKMGYHLLNEELTKNFYSKGLFSWIQISSDASSKLPHPKESIASDFKYLINNFDLLRDIAPIRKNMTRTKRNGGKKRTMKKRRNNKSKTKRLNK